MADGAEQDKKASKAQKAEAKRIKKRLKAEAKLAKKAKRVEEAEKCMKAPRDVFDPVHFGRSGGALRPSKSHQKQRRKVLWSELAFLLPMLNLFISFEAFDLLTLVALALPMFFLAGTLWGLGDSYRSTKLEVAEGALTVRRGYRRVEIPLTDVQGFEVRDKEAVTGFFRKMWAHYTGASSTEVVTMEKEPKVLPVRLAEGDAELFIGALEEMRVESKRQQAGRGGYRGVRVATTSRESHELTVPAEDNEAER